jgi:phage gpG-like protein
VSIHFEPGLVVIKRDAEDFAAQIEDLTELWHRFADLMAEVETERWDSEGFGSWPPLAASTLRQKHGGQLMVDTGALLASLTGSQAIKEISPQRMVYGTDVDYAHWHQDGGYKEGRPPRRVILDVPDFEEPRFEEEAIRFANEVAARTFGA